MKTLKLTEADLESALHSVWVDAMMESRQQMEDILSWYAKNQAVQGVQFPISQQINEIALRLLDNSDNL